MFCASFLICNVHLVRIPVLAICTLTRSGCVFMIRLDSEIISPNDFVAAAVNKAIPSPKFMHMPGVLFARARVFASARLFLASIPAALPH